MVFVKLLKDISIESLQNKIDRFIQHIPKGDIISVSINTINNNEHVATVVTYDDPLKVLEEY
jgi:hypothetical protein